MNIQVNQTKDYSKFKFLKLNRAVNKRHVTNLMKLNKERSRFHLFPIVVDKDMNIIDGQHRYTACKENNSPIFYITDNACTEDKFTEITKVNTATRSHSHTDIFDMLYKDNDRTAVTLKSYQKVLKKNHKLAVDIFTLIRIFTVTFKNGRTFNWPSGTAAKDNMQRKEFYLSKDSDYRVVILTKINSICGFGGGSMSSVFKAIYTIFNKNKIPLEEGITRLANNGFSKNNALEGLTVSQVSTHVVKTYNKRLSQNKKIAE